MAGETDQTQISTGKKTAATRPPETALKCPRCDSPNTKFCYYNNYSLTQPRHFCKTCRRYWTKGGALRNVPIGGGCRKNKKVKDSSKDVGGSTEYGGFKLFNGFSPAVDFQLGRVNNPFNQFSSLGDVSENPSSSMDFNYRLSSGFNQDMGSSIESLSSINQDFHWKLQQQRLAMLSIPHQESQVQKLQPILFQNLEVERKEVSNGDTGSEWLFGNSYAPLAAPPGNGGNENENGGNWNNRIQAWSDLPHFNSLP